MPNEYGPPYTDEEIRASDANSADNNVNESPGKAESNQLPMKDKEIEYWQDQIKLCKESMKERHEEWSENIAEYNMDFNVPGLESNQIIHLSRMYPLARQIISTVAYNYPRMAIGAEPLSEDDNTDLSLASEVFERAGDMTLKLTELKEEVHQATFDSLLCGIGWIKQGYNPPGDDAVAPYVSNDAFREDFPYGMRVNPFNIFVDPLCPPHNLGHARYIIERIYVPIEFLRTDGRYKGANNVQPVGKVEAGEDEYFQDIAGEASQDQIDVMKRARETGGMALLWEIHDRIHRKIITFADGVKKPIENTDHPFRKSLSITEIDPMTGEEVVIDTIPAQGFIMHHGFQYIPVKMDIDAMSFYPKPSFSYVKDLQRLVVESVSRRMDQLARFKRLVWVKKSEMQQNKSLQGAVSEAEDGELVELIDLDSIREADWGSVPSDQLNLENDALGYEQQSLHVAGESASGSHTATGAAIAGGQSSLNREWMQSKISDVYVTFIKNSFRMFRDYRYFPERFLANIASANESMQYKFLTADDFSFEFNLTMDAASMQPLNEQLERDDTILLYDRLSGHPLIDQTEIVKDLMRGFRVRTPERKLKQGGKSDVQALVQMELQLILQGQDPGVMPAMDHEFHINSQSPEAIQGMEEFMQIPPDFQQAVMQIAMQHVESHQQQLQADSTPTAGGSQPSVDGRLTGNQSNLQSLVRANAQQFNEQAMADARTLTRQGG